MTTPHRLSPRTVALAVILTFLHPAGSAQQVEVPTFLNPGAIILRADHTETPSAASLEWGRQVLKELEVQALPPEAAAAKIAHYLHREFDFTPDRPDTVDAFVETKAGNCYAHARLGAMLLRLNGIPAKFAYEIHLERKTNSAARAARESGIALFGHYHNDHFWVLFHDGKEWVPFDSALGISGFDEFREAKYVSPAGGVSNPPFVIWEDQGQGLTGMRNVTRTLWTRLGAPAIPHLSRSTWDDLVAAFADVEVDDLMAPIDPGLEEIIARAGREFFSVADPGQD